MMFKKGIRIAFCMIFISCSIVKPTSKNHEELVLNGKINQKDLIEKFPWFEDNYKRYFPNDSIINQIKEFPYELKVLVFMGTWCDDSKNEVPKFFKISQALQFHENQVKLIAVDRNKHCDSIDISSYKIELVPTFIFYKNEKEIGRIIESPKETLEKDLLKIMNEAEVK
jgi:thiol-disulfide isomerase/thioredoxin